MNADEYAMARATGLPPLQVNHRSRGIFIDSGLAIAYNVSTWELVKRRKVLPYESFPNFIFVIYIGLGKG